MEQFYEQNVINNHIDERVKKTKTLNIAKTVCLVIAISVLIMSAIFVTDDSFGFILIILVVVSLPFFGATLLIGHINKRNNTEYDYTIDDEYLKVTEIYYRSRRKLKYSVRLRAVESVGQFGSEGYTRAESSAQKKILALVNFDDEKSIMYMLYSTEKGRRIIFLEPDIGFIIALRRVVSAVTVFDKSVADLEKIINGAKEE